MPMVGRPIRDANGKVVGIACSREEVRRCSAGCGRRATRLCDFPLKGILEGKTCDRDLCDRCRTEINGKDYCAPHAKVLKEDDAK